LDERVLLHRVACRSSTKAPVYLEWRKHFPGHTVDYASFIVKSNYHPQSTLESYVVQIWSRYPLKWRESETRVLHRVVGGFQRDW